MFSVVEIWEQLSIERVSKIDSLYVQVGYKLSRMALVAFGRNVMLIKKGPLSPDLFLRLSEFVWPACTEEDSFMYYVVSENFGNDLTAVSGILASEPLSPKLAFLD